MTAGYSSTPLAKKLGIKFGFKFSIINEPAHYMSLFSDWPMQTECVENMTQECMDFIHVFCSEEKDLHLVVQQIPYLKKTGSLWVSWVKRSSPLPSIFKEDHIRNYLLDAGLVDVKVAAIDKDWSGLKFVYRLKDR